MRGWPLYLSILGGAVVLALALKTLPPGVVIVVALIGVAVVSMRVRRTARAGADAVSAVGLGFQRSPTDPFSLRTLPLALFGRGSDQRIADVTWGTWGDVEIKLFSFAYRDADGTRRTFTCALAQAPTEGVALVVEPTSFLIPEPDRAPMPVVSVGGGDFDAAFDVRSDDGATAIRLLDEATRQHLRSLQERWAFELRDRMLVCYSPASGIDPMESLGTISLLRRSLGVRTTAPVDDPFAAGRADAPEA